MKLANRSQVDILREKNILKSPLEDGLYIASRSKKGRGKTYYLRDDLWVLSSFYLKINSYDPDVKAFRERRKARYANKNKNERG